MFVSRYFVYWILSDFICIFASLLLSWLFCNDFSRIKELPEILLSLNWVAFSFWLLFKYMGYYIARIPQTLWHYANYGDFIRGAISIVLVGIVGNVFIYYGGGMHFSLPAMILIVIFDLQLLLGTRVLWRCLAACPEKHRWVGLMQLLPLFHHCKMYDYYKFQIFCTKNNKEDRVVHNKSVMIVGAGDAGKMMIEEYNRNPQLGYTPTVLIDDDTKKRGQYIQGLQVIGNRNDIVTVASKKNIDVIVIAMPKAQPHTIAELCQICKMTSCELKILPSICSSLQDSQKLYSSIRNVKIEDLLGRAIVDLEDPHIKEFLQDKVILITGAGGSIGSEIVRSIARVGNCQQLILIDIYENNLYDIQQELNLNFPHIKVVSLIASIREASTITRIFTTYHPHIVFHAAAHKHVPLMESMPAEAIKNNVFGTFNLVTAAHAAGVERFIQISTDKAVRPTNVMGASKRLCEMIIQAANELPEIPGVVKTQFAAVRFGNVLGSNGSVIPLFKKQIEKGGPLTITDKRITRFFMTIPEAASLVLYAGSLAKGGEIFILDMGKEVKILDLAKNLIRLAGLTPEVDIQIKEIGLRPGEKLYEELLMDEEKIETSHPKIFIGTTLQDITWQNVQEKLICLSQGIGENTDIRQLLREVVPTYNPDTANPSHRSDVITTMSKITAKSKQLFGLSAPKEVIINDISSSCE